MDHAFLGLAANPALPSELLARLVAFAVADAAAEADDPVGDFGRDVVEVLAERPDLGQAQIIALSRVDSAARVLAAAGRLTADDIDPTDMPFAAIALLDHLAELADSPSASPAPPDLPSAEWMRLLATHSSPQVRERLAGCPVLPRETVELLAADPVVDVVAELALRAPADIAAALARHRHADVRRAVAVNEATPPDVLAALLTGDALLPPAEVCVVCVDIPPPFVHAPDCDRPDCCLPAGAECNGAHESTIVITQQIALGNPATPAEVAVRFVGHWSMWARVQLAARADLPAAGYEQLAADEIPWVRNTLAENPAIGEPLMRVLAADTGHDVQRCLLQNPNVPWDVLTALAGTVRTGMVLLPRIAAASAEQVRQLAESADPAVRALVARRRDLPAEIRDRLAADDAAKVIAAVAAHPGLPEPTLLAMVARHTGQVVTQAATNPDATPAVLAAIAAHRPPPSGRAMKSVALHPSAPAETLLTCLTDPKARRFAAAHPSLPTTAIVELLDDADREVVEAAAANPALPPEAMARLLTAATTPTPPPGS